MGAWSLDSTRDLLADANLGRVRAALTPGNVIFGWHYFYAGGGSGKMFTFDDFESYREEVLKSRPGDHFTVYSLDRLLDRAIARAGAPSSTDSPALETCLGAVKEAVAGENEVAFVWRYLDAATGSVRCEADTLWDMSEPDWAEFHGVWRNHPGQLAFFLIETLDADQDGNPIETVSAIPPRRRIHAIADGKRPDERGFTPETGIY